MECLEVWEEERRNVGLSEGHCVVGTGGGERGRRGFLSVTVSDDLRSPSGRKVATWEQILLRSTRLDRKSRGEEQGREGEDARGGSTLSSANACITDAHTAMNDVAAATGSSMLLPALSITRNSAAGGQEKPMTEGEEENKITAATTCVFGVSAAAEQPTNSSGGVKGVRSKWRSPGGGIESQGATSGEDSGVKEKEVGVVMPGTEKEEEEEEALLEIWTCDQCWSVAMCQ